LGETRILVVDDDETIRKSISRVLETAGYTVDAAKDGKAAIQKAESNFYNLALIDIRLPDMEGTQLLTLMKETTPKMVKMVLTGSPSLQNAVEAVNKGADGYVLKPAKMDELLRVVKEHLKKQQEARVYSEEKVKEFIETRVKELEKGENPHPAKRP
jgi:DNA-binding response OmpR family regulator